MYFFMQDVVSLKRREDYEEKLMDYIETNFAFLERDEIGEVKVRI